jgi:two-component system, NtrC family, sensor histidine kinase PilS
VPPDIDRRSKQYLIFRLLIIVLGFGLVSFYKLSLGQAFGEHTFMRLYGLLGVYLLFGLALFFFYPRWRGRHEIIRWQVVGDFVFQSLLVWGTGGVLSIFSPRLFGTLVAATSVISAREAFILATAAMGFLTLTTLAYGTGIAPFDSGSTDRYFGGEKSTFVFSYLLASVLALYAISTLGSRLSHGLRNMEGIQSEILENIAEGLIAVDRDGRVLRMNREARKLLGLPGDEAQFRKLDLSAILRDSDYGALREAFEQDRKRRFQTSVGLPDGAFRPVEVKISTVQDDLGGTRFRIGLISDLTLKREVEAAERRIQKLEDLQVMALGLAHEIRNPLASLRGCVQEISRLSPDRPDTARYMEIVRRESDRLDRILEDFLLYARSGPIDLVPLDLVPVIEEAVLLLRSRPDLRDRTVKFTGSAERFRIFGDRNRLIQVFLNVGLNGLEATASGKGALSVSARHRRFAPPPAGTDLKGGIREERDPVPGVEVEFCDNGSGMGSSDMKKVFTPFFTTKERGNGLGLCVVERIVREHMGYVDFSSEEGKGTTFRLWFPLISSDVPASRSEGPTSTKTLVSSHV